MFAYQVLGYVAEFLERVAGVFSGLDAGKRLVDDRLGSLRRRPLEREEATTFFSSRTEVSTLELFLKSFESGFLFRRCLTLLHESLESTLFLDSRTALRNRDAVVNNILNRTSVLEHVLFHSHAEREMCGVRGDPGCQVVDYLSDSVLVSEELTAAFLRCVEAGEVGDTFLEQPSLTDTFRYLGD